MRGIIAAVVLLAASAGAVVGIAASSGGNPNARLDQVASSFANHPIRVRCRTSAVDPTFESAWGYVNTPVDQQTEAFIQQAACLGAAAIADDDPAQSDFMKAIGAAVLVHESFHLSRQPGVNSESITECRAFLHYDVVLLRLGASPEVVSRLMPLMIIIHYRLTTRTEWLSHHGGILGGLFGGTPSYYRPTCGMPDRYYPYTGRRQP